MDFVVVKIFAETTSVVYDLDFVHAHQAFVETTATVYSFDFVQAQQIFVEKTPAGQMMTDNFVWGIC